MKKILKWPILILLLMLSLSIGSFMLLNPLTINSEESVKADIVGVSSEVVYLTGSNGSDVYHYFTNSEGNSTLSYVESGVLESYYNESGQSCQDRYAIVGKSAASKNYSQGTATFKLTNDMKNLAEKGILYVQASVGAIAKDDDQNDRVNFTLKSGNLSKTVTSSKVQKSGTISPEWLKTDFIQVNKDSDITFSFKALDQGGGFNYSKFGIYEPKFVFKVLIDDIDFEGSEETVYPGQILTLNGTNDVLNETGTSEFMKYYKILFKMNYTITKGAQYASISSGKLLVKSSAPDNTEIVVSATSRKDSITGETTTAKTKTFKVNAKKYEVKINTDFASPATFVGNGSYYEGQKITLRATVKSGFTFNKWIINGEEKTTTSVAYIVKKENSIKAYFTKNTRVLSITGVTKAYDGSAQTQYSAILEGIESNHDVSLGGITAKYITANVGENKELVFEGSPTLVGADKDLYNLTSSSIPSGYGTITQKEITVTAAPITKVYGNRDENIPYTISEEGITLNGSLTRQTGEDVGQYDITADNFISSNPNYKINFVKSTYTIEKRELSIEFNDVTKVYDHTTDVQLSHTLSNIAFDDYVRVDYKAAFVSSSVGRNQIEFSKFEINGEKKNNYKITIPTIYGTITEKDITITAKNASKVFGENDQMLQYSVTGLINGDELTGSLSREVGEGVGSYAILLNTLGNTNYKVTFNSAEYTILQRDVTVKMLSCTKTYGDVDPEFSYEVENGVVGAVLSGKATRLAGENVGTYKMLQGTLNNSNYNITFISDILTINKRNASVEIKALGKTYDGQDTATCEYRLYNVLSSDEIEIQIEAKFDNKNVGQNKSVTIIGCDYLGESVSNYNFTNSGTLIASISKREVVLNVRNIEKYYGDKDPVFNYEFENIVNGDKIEIDLERDEGEIVGDYSISLNSYENNNYQVIYNGGAALKILPKILNVKAVDYSKIFGEDDPAFTFITSDRLAFEDTMDEVFSGGLTREEGNKPARYRILIGSLQVGSNYAINFTEGYLTIQKRDIVVTAIDAAKVYGEDDPEFLYTAQNTVEGNDVHMSLRREYGEDVGTYVITYSTLNDAKYNITFNTAVFTITPRAISVKADDKFKNYGDKDPEFSVSVTSGELQFNDNTDEIFIGKMSRDVGEDIGTYTIKKGDFTLGDNYTITFEEGSLTILKTEIEIKANNITKKYGNQDGELTFTISKGSLKFNDVVQGNLEREIGEEVGTYEISRGTLALSENYIVTFTPAIFEIERRPITIYADAVTKTYGEDDPELTYTVEGGIVEGDVLSGNLFREKPSYDTNPKICEMAGRYLITSTLENENYDITYVSSYFTIKQREIFIEADNKTKIYGEEDPELSYHIISGEILDGEEFTGNIYRASGNDAGKYDIRSSLSLGRNYKIIFTKGVFEILPIEITIKTHNYEKIYGESNPVFEYEIIEGELLGNDVLLGGISKEPGEDVGTYRLVSVFNNTNYKVVLTENYLEIKKKDAYLNVSIQDKVYNGDTVAYIKQPVVTGLIDEGIIISYDKENSARFVSPEVGNNIEVHVYGITLTGEKAGNYNLIMPQSVYGNITYNILTTEDEKVFLETNTNTDLTVGSKLVVETENINSSDVENPSKQVVMKYNIKIEDGTVTTQLKDPITVKFELPLNFRGRNNYYVYGTNKDGERVLFSSKVEGEYLKVTTDCLGEFIVLSDNESWLDICIYVSTALVAALAIFFTVYIIKRHKKKMKKQAEEEK